MNYKAPVREMRFVLDTVCGWQELARGGAFPDLSGDLVDAILEEAGKFAAGVFAPLNAVGDRHGAVLENGVVRLPKGFREAYRQFVEAGWNCVSAPAEYGGQGLPFMMQIAVQESMAAANLSFSLCPMLTQGVVEALLAHGTPAQKAAYLPKLVSGEWTGTMNLTEPQAGSDVGALKTRAVANGDGSYKITGTKIFITWGEHDCADNIVHLVLARLPDAPAGTKGISLFLVPKFLVDADGGLGRRNDVRCASLEHKLGIHASPTCVMAYGDNDDCVGYLVGEENRGMACMFTMMNNARINVGLQGVAIAARAYQGALAYARERVQSAKFGSRGPAVRIIEHADVRRMLMTMKAQTEAARAIVYLTAAALDRAHHGVDAQARDAGRALADLLTPVAKAHATDIGVEVASQAIQVFGGMGYVEETGVAQYYRDARIAPIYEGTNGIQAIDLVGRKLPQGGGAAWRHLVDKIRRDARALPQPLDDLAPALVEGADALERASDWLMARASEQPDDAAAGAVPYLRLLAGVLGAHLLTEQAAAAHKARTAGAGEDSFLSAKAVTARFYVEQILPSAVALLGPVTRGAAAFYALDEEQLAL
ncbi:MAG: acyl-CoA dehydrogenase [Alphaproteobacteria bacterium]|nr:MAG: acyl-CoA dehydrogenase [Alphaproteobacteria bacterium]